MSNDLRVLEDWAGALLVKLGPAERRRLTQSIARDLRRSQQQRIASQRNPDGSAYAPRKPRKLRNKAGRIRKKMFAKLRTARHLKLQSSAERIAIGFLSRTSRLARVHQYGLRDRAARNAPEVKYSQRELLGFSEGELEHIRGQLLAHLVRA